MLQGALRVVNADDAHNPVVGVEDSVELDNWPSEVKLSENLQKGGWIKLIHGDKAADVTGSGTQLQVQTEDESTTIDPEWVFDIEDEACSWPEKDAEFRKSGILTTYGRNEAELKFDFGKTQFAYLELKGGTEEMAGLTIATVSLDLECGDLTPSPGTIIFRRKNARSVKPHGELDTAPSSNRWDTAPSSNQRRR